MPKSLALSGTKYHKLFDSSGQLRRINGLNYWPLHKVLHEKYRFKEEEAVAFADFLLPMLEWDPEKRASAKQMLDHPWLARESNYETRYTKEEFEDLKKSRKENEEEQEGYKAEMSKLELSDIAQN